jgi:hypothetical protein
MVAEESAREPSAKNHQKQRTELFRKEKSAGILKTAEKSVSCSSRGRWVGQDGGYELDNSRVSAFESDVTET